MFSGKKKEKIGVQDIADILNVSVSTVSRALNDHPRISTEMKEKVKQTALRLGYHPGVPELMNPEKKEVIALLVPSLSSGLYREIVAGAVDFMNENDYQAFILDIRNNDHRAFSFFKTYRKYGISGIIHLLSSRNLPEGFYSVVQNDKLPLVTVFEPDTAEGISTVVPDLFQGVYKITEYLKPMNVNGISLILDDENRPENYQLATSFKMALELSGMEKTPFHIHYLPDFESAFSAQAESLLRSKKRPEVLIVKNTLSAAEVLKAAEKLNIRIPDDMFLIAIGIPEHYRLTSNLSLLKLPGYKMGYQAAKILLNRIKHPHAEKKTVVLPVSFILKSSAIRIE